MTEHRTSLRRQLATNLSLGITVLWLLTITAVAVTMIHEMNEVFDANLEQTAGRILPLASPKATGQGIEDKPPMPVALGDEELNYVIRDPQGTVLLRSRNAVISDFATVVSDGFGHTPTQRTFRETDAASGYSVTVGEPLAHRREAAFDTIGALVLPVFLLVPLCLIAIFWTVRRALRPVDQLRSELSRRGGTDLRPLGEIGLPLEMVTIVKSVNQLLERVNRTLEAERSFTANSAHEMRTPVAAALAQCQRLVAELVKSPAAERAKQVEAELQRLSRLSEKLMQLARAESGSLEAPAQDMVPVLQAVVEDFRRAGHDRRITLTMPETRTAPMALDPDAFGILARNLIENALRHGDSAEPVQVELCADGRFSVKSGGPAVSHAVLAGLTARFARGGSKAEGSGLGLAIADTIARASGGELTLSSPISGRDGGFEAALKPKITASHSVKVGVSFEA